MFPIDREEYSVIMLQLDQMNISDKRYRNREPICEEPIKLSQDSTIRISATFRCR